MAEVRYIDIYDVTRAVDRIGSAQKAEVYERLGLSPVDCDRLDRKMREARKLGYIKFFGKYWSSTEAGRWYIQLHNFNLIEACYIAKSISEHKIRVIRAEGSDLPVPKDKDEKRVKVELKDGVVVRVFGLG